MQRSAKTDTPPLGRFYKVGDRRLLVHRSGTGGASVVFLAGGGAVGLDYLNVQKLAAELTTSVLYDRGGTGWSDPVKPGGRTSAQVTDELRELLKTADVPRPYILVGHSLGGLYARHFAQRFRNDVAGLLLLDPAHEDYDAYMPEDLAELRKPYMKRQSTRLVNLIMAGGLRSGLIRGLIYRVPAVRRYRQLYRRLFEQEMRDWPKEIRDALIERHTSLDWLWAGMQEVQNIYEVYDEVRQAGPMPDVPLILLCSTGIDEFKRAVLVGESEEQLRAEIEGKRRLHEALAASVTRGENRLVDGGHFTMYMRNSGAVIQSIEDLLGRSGSTWGQSAQELLVGGSMQELPE